MFFELNLIPREAKLIGKWVAPLTVSLFACRLGAQDSYEIQGYGAETIPRGETMIELHSNYTFEGNRQTINGVLPNYHALHETIEVTHRSEEHTSELQSRGLISYAV